MPSSSSNTSSPSRRTDSDLSYQSKTERLAENHRKNLISFNNLSFLLNYLIIYYILSNNDNFFSFLPEDDIVKIVSDLQIYWKSGQEVIKLFQFKEKQIEIILNGRKFSGNWMLNPLSLSELSIERWKRGRSPNYLFLETLSFILKRIFFTYVIRFFGDDFNFEEGLINFSNFSFDDSDSVEQREKKDWFLEIISSSKDLYEDNLNSNVLNFSKSDLFTSLRVRKNFELYFPSSFDVKSSSVKAGFFIINLKKEIASLKIDRNVGEGAVISHGCFETILLVSLETLLEGFECDDDNSKFVDQFRIESTAMLIDLILVDENLKLLKESSFSFLLSHFSIEKDSLKWSSLSFRLSLLTKDPKIRDLTIQEKIEKFKDFFLYLSQCSDEQKEKNLYLSDLERRFST